jgi:hypothetical protein
VVHLVFINILICTENIDVFFSIPKVKEISMRAIRRHSRGRVRKGYPPGVVN